VGAVATVVLPDGRPVAVTGGEDATVRIWDLQRKTGVQEPLHLVGPVSALAALHLPTGVHLAITGAGITTIELRHQAL
jgi:WD40 repeat protein